MEATQKHTSTREQANTFGKTSLHRTPSFVMVDVNTRRALVVKESQGLVSLLRGTEETEREVRREGMERGGGRVRERPRVR